MEYLVNISKRRAFWSLNEDILKITILKTNTPYPSRKIRRIRACTHQRPQRNKAQYAVSREDQYAVLEIWNEYNILEDIKRGPYSKKSLIRLDFQRRKRAEEVEQRYQFHRRQRVIPYTLVIVQFLVSFVNSKDDRYCNGGNLPRTYIIGNQLHYQDYKWYEALEDSELKYEALRNKAIMEGFINEGDDESHYEQEKRWNIYTNYDDAYEINHEDNERE
ncbi:hypothetical protein Tco_1121396 [Tanacetum coccineum]|uniref:Uncharacterized protein n=1 Tax=Tanacetum coccineum TaxID=301880 RepID=A0ABQ5IXZ1_9ASTR